MTIFETERLIVRKFTDTDADDYFALNSNEDVMRYIRPVRTREECDKLFNETVLKGFADNYKGIWAIHEKEGGKLIGCFVIMPIPEDIEKTQLGYSFLPEYWGKGFATEVTKAGLDYFRNQTPLTEIYAVTETPHIASQKVLLKNGFQFFEKKMPACPVGREGEKELLIFIVKRN
ncbi:MAG TPA: GNAT family N-acetyltransferase [Chitinophagaceae bacterium]|nr:GNAT family N-acetyltransferase [Chitinophagaceae bacterium]